MNRDASDMTMEVLCNRMGLTEYEFYIRGFLIEHPAKHEHDAECDYHRFLRTKGELGYPAWLTSHMTKEQRRTVPLTDFRRFNSHDHYLFNGA